MKILCRRGKFKDTEKLIRYHPIGIGIGTDIVFGISVPENTAGSIEIPKYRISFGILSSAILSYITKVSHQPLTTMDKFHVVKYKV